MSAINHLDGIELTMDKRALLKIKDFDSLLEFLVDDLEWPIPEGLGEYELTFVYTPEEIGLSSDQAEKMSASVKQLRPFTEGQPWAIFWLDFETKKMPVTVLRRILRHFVVKRRATNPDAPTWQMEDIMFVAGHGEEGAKGVTFAHFKNLDGKEVMREFSWNSQEQSFDNYINYLDYLKWEEEFENDPEAWKTAWRKAFTGSTREAVRNSKQLSIAMAWIARDIRDRVKEVYEIEHENGALHQLYNTFREGLIHDMSVDQFADMYAQTMTYGLFTARTMDTDGQFQMHEVTDLIPSTNPFLKQLFKECLEVGTDHNQIDLDELGIGRLVDLLDGLNRSDGTDGMTRIMEEFGRKTFGGNEDPVIHFYEEFLKEYDQLQRVDRGVYYTPDAVVDFIVRSVNEQLKTEFGLEMGLADITTWDEMVASGRAEWPKDPKTGKTNQALKDKLKKRAFVQILDPATGTGTFLIRAITEIHAEVKAKHKRDNISTPWVEYWNEYVYKDLFPRLYGFELMMASYSVAHMRIGMHLKSLGYKFKKGQRLNIYLTNTLESPDEMGSGDLFYSSIGSESAAAKLTKQDRLFSVVIGNPPYSNSSTNNGDWIRNQIRDYKKDLKEKKINLDDDYIKFIKLGQYYINKNNSGILAYISNNSFIEGLTHRRMRESILNDFNKCYILDLHGDAKKGEVSITGDRDENVFDIRTGVSIEIFTKSGYEKSELFHKGLVGNRSYKYDFLSKHSFIKVDWKKLSQIEPYYFFVPKNFEGNDSYNEGFSLTELFIEKASGIHTGKDHLVIEIDKNVLKNRVNEVISCDDEDLVREKYDLKDTSGWTLSRFKSTENYDDNYVQLLFRVFDKRWILYENKALKRDRGSIMRHVFKKENISLVSIRRSRSKNLWNFIFVSKLMTTEPTTITSLDNNYIFPLYLYDDNSFSFEGNTRSLNLSKAILEKISNSLGIEFSSDRIVSKAWCEIDLLDYIYAVLNSVVYRTKYNEFLNIDFPRVPYPKYKETFWQLVKLGGELRQIHLLESDVVNDFITEFPVTGSNEVTKSMTAKSPGWVASEYTPDIGDVWINDEQYFFGVPKIAWEFYIGGYKPAQKWLKDRKGRNLTQEDIEHYQKIIVALTETDRIMQEIDKIEIE